MDERVAVLLDPRDTGNALPGPMLGAYWRYRVGDYLVIFNIQDTVLCVLVAGVKSRKDEMQNGKNFTCNACCGGCSSFPSVGVEVCRLCAAPGK